MTWLFSFDAAMVMPLLACLVLIGMLVYLGIHVVSRKVIFVDLCLAQIAALGAIAGALIGRYDPDRDTTAIYLYSLGFTLFGAFLLSVTKARRERVPHEALIGIIYVVAFAATLLALSKSGLGDQQIKSILEGHILYVEPQTVTTTALIFAVLGLFHLLFRKTFLRISIDPEGAAAAGVRVALWDFIFYASFGIAVTSAVRIAGIFLVFTYLIVPAVGAMLFARGLRARLLTGWLGAAVVSFYGIKLAYVERLNLPISPSIVCLFAVVLMGALAARSLAAMQDGGRARRRLAIVAVVLAVFTTGLFAFRKERIEGIEKTLMMLGDAQSGTRQGALRELLDLLYPDPGHHGGVPTAAEEAAREETASVYREHQDLWVPAVITALSDPDREVRLAALDLIEELQPHTAVTPTSELLEDPDDLLRERAIEVLRAYHDPTCNGALLKALAAEHEPDLMAMILDALLEAGERRAVGLSIDLLARQPSDLPELVRQDLYEHLQAHLAFKFDPGEIDRVADWWQTNGERIRWDEASRRFTLESR